MWQRIQTLFLIIAIALNASLFALPIAELKWEESTYQFLLEGMKNDEGTVVYSSMTLIVVCLASILVSTLIIFMYQKRQMQIKLSQLNLLIQAALVALIFFFTDSAVSSLGNTEGIAVEYSAGAFISLIPLLFIYLAIRGIKKDEALVRAADRIR